MGDSTCAGNEDAAGACAAAAGTGGSCGRVGLRRFLSFAMRRPPPVGLEGADDGACGAEHIFIRYTHKSDAEMYEETVLKQETFKIVFQRSALSLFFALLRMKYATIVH